MSKARTFGIIFLTILISDVVILSIPAIEHLRIISKPLIVGSLIFYSLFNLCAPRIQKQLILLALVFSLIGDTLLMFEEKSSFFFIGGLISFLITHLLYIKVFLKQKDSTKNPYIVAVILTAIASILFLYLRRNLGDLLIPVIIYMVVIVFMVTAAYLRSCRQDNKSYFLVLIGASLFMVSDSLLAIAKFKIDFTAASQMIIITYGIAQFLIILGLQKYYQLGESNIS